MERFSRTLEEQAIYRHIFNNLLDLEPPPEKKSVWGISGQSHEIKEVNMPFLFKSLFIPEVIYIEPKVFPDDRGYFLETFKSSDFLSNNIPNNFVQENLSFSRKNIIRGMHFQKKPKEQAKLVSVIKGRVLDVAVDVRKKSPTFMKWIAVELNDRQHAMLYIPEGFAHGFLSLTEEVYLLYKCTKEYDPKTDFGIRWDDPDIGIEWPVNNPVVSEKDQRLPYLKQLNI